MNRNTANVPVIGNLQNALVAFLADHKDSAESDEDWVLESVTMTEEELAERSGCGCDDCDLAAKLLDRI